MALSTRDRWAWTLGLASAATVALVIVWLGGVALIEGLAVGGAESSRQEARLLPAVVGTIGLVVIGWVSSAPIAVAGAIYLEELDPPRVLARALEMNAAALAAIPSVVWGLFGAAVWVQALALGDSLWSGGLTLGALMLPVELVAAREGLRSVPRGVREAAVSLGATQWQALWRVVVPAAIPGIATGMVLSIARAAGEAAPLLMVGALAYVRFAPLDPGGAYTALPIQVFSWLIRPDGEFTSNAAIGALVLLLTALGLSAVAVWGRARRQERVPN